MANEILYAGIANQTQAESVTAEFLYSIADRRALPNHPALLHVGDTRGSGSQTKKLPVLGLAGKDELQAVAEGSDVANTALSDDAVTVSTAKYSKAYEISDEALSIAGTLNPQVFAMDAVQASAVTLTSLIAELCDGFSNVVGSTGVDMTAADFLEALAQLEINNVEGPYMCILHGRQWHDLVNDLATASNGAMQWVAAQRDMIDFRSTMYKGRLLDGADVFVSNRIPTMNAGADRGGAMFGYGAIAWADMSVDVPSDANTLNIGGKVLFERDRSARGARTAFITHRHLGVAEGLDAAGVTIQTDA